MRKIKTILIVLLSIFLVTGCATKDSRMFKKDYESLNNKTNATGKAHRNVSIKSNNPIVYTTAEEVIKMMDNNETFYVYFGDKLCPWCRSVIESMLDQAKENNIKKIYYVSIWDDDGKEILRDKYKLNDNNELELEFAGTESYKKLLERFDSLLRDYTLTDKNNKSVEVGEKRIFAPNFVYIKNGKAINLVTGISDNQSDSRSELTDEIKNDMNKIFNDFFKNK